ncbi:MAG: DUF2141 domain-containing protein [Tannerella sp.]|jgi:uncharacterized protein (DUF2141 family)|nr:DUF2141 domain-containing protein [Tannerella sp.]
MKTVLFALAVLAASFAGAQNKLTVVIEGIEKTEGTIPVAVYDSTGFLKKPVYTGLVGAGREEASVVIEDVAPGEYAVSIFHDENGNYKLDVDTFGIPTEKTGFSNNAKGKMGPPKFTDCMIKVEEDSVIYITLQKSARGK